MKISLDDFKTHIGVGGLHKAGLHAIPRVHGIVTKFYCDKLTVRSACSGKCAECILNLKTRLDTTTWEGSKPYALFTFTVKDVSAKVMDATHEVKAEPAKPAMFQAEEEKDVLDLFMETLACLRKKKLPGESEPTPGTAGKPSSGGSPMR
jgi:hypothetical protein